MYVGTEGIDSPGWRVATELDGSHLYVTTRHVSPEGACPDGIEGAYDRGTDFDESFSVACHDEIVETQCCLRVVLNATR